MNRRHHALTICFRDGLQWSERKTPPKNARMSGASKRFQHARRGERKPNGLRSQLYHSLEVGKCSPMRASGIKTESDFNSQHPSLLYNRLLRQAIALKDSRNDVSASQHIDFRVAVE